MASIDVSIRTAALLALSQDVCALIALTVEATLSVLNFIYRSILGVLGYERTVRFDHSRSVRRESGRGCGVVVLGANEAAGQSLTLHLAKIGYTVFPLIPLPAPSSPPTSSALTHLLLTWSSVQKRLRARFPGHPGAVVPVMVDPEGISDHLSSSARGDLKRSTNSIKEEMGEGRFSHAGETVRAYCKDNKLMLVSIICINRKSKVVFRSDQGNNGFNLRSAGSTEGTREDLDHTNGSPVMMQRSLSAPSTSNSASNDAHSPPPKEDERKDTTSANSNTISTGTGTLINKRPSEPIIPPSLPSTSLTMTDEHTMISLYRSNILDPLAIIKELSDLLSVPCTQGYSNGRIVFIDGEKANQGRIIELNDYTYSDEAVVGAQEGGSEFHESRNKVVEFIYGVREKVVGIVREEMRGIGVNVCEVIVGPMSPRIGTTGYHLRHSSEDSNEGASAILGDTLKRPNSDVDVILKSPRTVRRSESDWLDRCLEAVSSRFHLLTRLWAVDDALLFSSVRRAIEDSYVRYHHRAGISPWVEELLGWVPFNLGYISKGVVKELLKFGLGVEWIVEEWWKALTK
nr:uncharacterized protein I203_05493 [Kwoniella mangroviensis CBS 8507]OCF65247.1 hypothetical protein I203_05493 [Kwoniella mangroviensis CBS 8507]